MKLKSVKILGGDFRSLAANKLYEFNHSFRNDRLSTKVFAGLNGSGKSNFLELFSEIFYYLETYHLSTVSKTEKRNKNFGFEIEYFLPFSEENRLKIYGSPVEEKFLQVRIIKNLEEEPQFSVKRESEPTYSRRVEEDTQLLLPSKVVAYTSGQNELLSNPYYKLKYHYFKEFSKNVQGNDKDLADNHRLFFLDYNANFSIFIANMLLGNSSKLNYLNKILRINNLNSFRITVNMVDLYKKVIPLSDTLLLNLNKLKLCATTWVEKKRGREHLLILDYYVDSASRKAFEFHFTSAFNLFKVFYELEIMNLFLVGKDTSGLMLKVHKSFNFSDELPKPDPSRLVFRIEKIRINKTVNESENKTKDIYYKALSDGEHQFNEIIGTVLMMEDEGCLFLFDEPDTHFNPMWRAKLIKLLNFVTATNLEERQRFAFDSKGQIKIGENNQPMKETYLFPTKVRNQEIIITTHSPFVISDSESQDVYKFEKIDNSVHYESPDIKTYGASVGLILETIFDRDISISDFSNDDLKAIKESIKTAEDLQIAKKLLSKFGESIEKFDAFSFLMAKEEEFKKDKKDAL